MNKYYFNVVSNTTKEGEIPQPAKVIYSYLTHDEVVWQEMSRKEEERIENLGNE